MSMAPGTAFNQMILIVEDERSIAENLLFALESEGMTADIARNAAAALYRLEREKYDLVVLDIGLPDLDGYSLLRQLRQEFQLATPVLMLTARSALEDKVQGFINGADDYLTKPFALQELVLRAKALIRRSQQLCDTAFVLRFGPLELSLSNQVVKVDGQDVRLTRKSLLILELLMRYAGRVVPRQKLEDCLWQGEPPSAEALRSQLHLLRKTLHAHGFDSIETVHGVGWRLAHTSAADQAAAP
ncbi:DNA-binding response regulator [Corticibacter populi]|uniref:DNA-binding response regulator n=1 Tax=Corticibacter populi TaxID=1550736 RepID=A0A3M6QYA2_9BURK|nr:response regulator transcription factor [Corticibacter populi]RMX07853.1 DNA-binding response regulator [Corticibacter populi]RZS35086.1 DNA-binding response OmpR family regulator [Corticibacter populi]